MNYSIPAASIHHVALSVKDYDRSNNFYCQVLGMTCINEWEFQGKKLCFLDVGNGSYLELHSDAGDNLSQGQRYLHFCIHTSDLEKAYAHAVEHGATPNRPPFDFVINSHPKPMPVKVAWLSGPDGEEIELFQHLL